jgi:4-diphosphocytidyl-2-C-methyl-D-erythritol kinase
MICFPHAKINLGLHVTERRSDGFHNIETLFYPVTQFCDALEVLKADTFTLTLSGLPVTLTEQEHTPDITSNLVVKAYDLLSKHFYNLPSVAIYLHKAIPTGAGLGGGSADASFMLKLLKELFTLPITDIELETLAASLGADCPFFIHGKPVVAIETGNVFTPTEISLDDYYIYIVKPPFSVSTKEAYSLVKPRRAELALTELASIPVDNWRNCLRNDFEPYIFEKYPVISEIKAKLYGLGAEYAAMSGSGAAVFGLFRQQNIDIKCFNKFFIWKGKL